VVALRRVTSFEEEHVAAQQLPPESDASATCLECGTELIVTRVTPVLFGSGFEELTLACKTCGFTKKIKIKRG
jgi:transcription elongation factor Elf1